MKSFKLIKSLKEAWSLYKDNFVVFFLWYACYFFIKSIASKGTIVLPIISMILWIATSYMIVKFVLSVLNGKKIDIFSKSFIPSVKELWNFVKTLISFYVISFGFIAVVMIPMYFIRPSMFFLSNNFPIYLVITILIGFAWMVFSSVRFGFACFSSIEENIGAIKSLKKSWKITKNNFWSILYNYFLIMCAFFILVIITAMVSMLLNSTIAGFVVQVILLMVVYPISIILILMIYRSLNGHHASHELKDDIKAIEEIVEDKIERVVKEAEIIKE